MIAQLKDWFDDYNSCHTLSALDTCRQRRSRSGDRQLKHTDGAGIQGQDQNIILYQLFEIKITE